MSNENYAADYHLIILILLISYLATSIIVGTHFISSF